MLTKILILFLLSGAFVKGQTLYNRMDLVASDDFQGESFIGRRIVILDNDTLVDQTPEINIQLELSPKITKKEIMADYFYMTTFSKQSTLAWWKDPIVIYMSEDFPEESKSDLMTFTDSINLIGTVKISYTNLREDSSLMILNHHSIPSYYGKNSLERLGEFPRKKLLFNNATYTLFRIDSKIDHGYIRINLEKVTDLQNLQRDLRRILYASLGFFIDSEKISEQSMLYRKYYKGIHLSEYDELLLKIHYDHLTEYRVNAYDLYELFWKKY